MSIGIPASRTDSESNGESLDGLSRVGNINVEKIVLLDVSDISLDADIDIRVDGIKEHHVKLLAAIPTALPPIVVSAHTGRVIDGVHRVHAARLRGDQQIAAVLFAGGDAEAVVLAVRLNSGHGLPLTRMDRRRATERVVASQPTWSDRRIAMLVGVSPKTVGAVRARSTEESPQLTSRLGRDGKRRPVNTAEGRLRASDILKHTPDASVGEVAAQAGVAVGTVRDVRRRLREGLDPIPSATRERLDRGTARSGARNVPSGTADPGDRVPGAQREPVQHSSESLGQQHAAFLEAMSADPSLRSSISGRVMLRAAHAQSVILRDSEQLVRVIPEHRWAGMAALARLCATGWLRLADDLDSSRKRMA